MTPDDTYKIDFEASIKDMGVAQPVDGHSTKNLAKPQDLSWQRETLGTIMEVD